MRCGKLAHYGRSSGAGGTSSRTSTCSDSDSDAGTTACSYADSHSCDLPDGGTGGESRTDDGSSAVPGECRGASTESGHDSGRIGLPFVSC
jgi:hypothetical protein